jgi:hypothetical protein
MASRMSAARRGCGRQRIAGHRAHGSSTEPTFERSSERTGVGPSVSRCPSSRASGRGRARRGRRWGPRRAGGSAGFLPRGEACVACASPGVGNARFTDRAGPAPSASGGGRGREGPGALLAQPNSCPRAAGCPCRQHHLEAVVPAAAHAVGSLSAPAMPSSIGSDRCCRCGRRRRAGVAVEVERRAADQHVQHRAEGDAARASEQGAVGPLEGRRSSGADAPVLLGEALPPAACGPRLGARSLGRPARRLAPVPISGPGCAPPRSSSVGPPRRRRARRRTRPRADQLHGRTGHALGQLLRRRLRPEQGLGEPGSASSWPRPLLPEEGGELRLGHRLHVGGGPLR